MKSRKKILFIIAGLALLVLLLVLVLSQTDLLSNLLGQTTAGTSQEDSSGTVLVDTTTPPVTESTPTTAMVIDPPQIDYACAFNPDVEDLQAEFDSESWLNWIELLSGAKPVEMNGETYTIKTRYTESLFNGDPDAELLNLCMTS